MIDKEGNITGFSKVIRDVTGYETTRELRKQGFIKPIIALTAHAMKEERKRCLESGFNEHVTKPIDKNNLIQLLSELPS